MPKIIELISQKKANEDKFFSLEFFPPRTSTGAINLVSRFDRMAEGGPLFIDITWGAGGGNPAALNSETSSMSIAANALNYCGLPTMLHLTCTSLREQELINILKIAKENGIRNILALRGDAPNEEEEWRKTEGGLSYAIDLVRLIRLHFGSFFGICVAGYPNGHPDCNSLEEDIQYLKEKVEAGADFVITQLFFEASTYLNWLEKCRAAGITCPIIPGILPIQGYASLRNLTKLSKLKIPQYIVDKIEPIKDDDKAIRQFGVELSVTMCKELLASGKVPGVHVYTLNREVAAKMILEQLSLWGKSHKQLPWTPSANDERQEDVRPIFWSARPKSYLLRTKDWDEFPNGRWGNSSSPAFGELQNYYLFYPDTKQQKEKLIDMWGTPTSLQDVYNVFASFLEKGTKVLKLPWTDSIAEETDSFATNLIKLNRNGILTINSQPAVNAISSSDPVHGWGGDNGYIYKKAYIEFFCSPEILELLIEIFKNFPQMQYHALNRDSSKCFRNCDCSLESNPVAVTWGVFPCKEIIQPTVVDPESFPIWAEEAFGLWNTQWGALYEESSEARKIISKISNSFYLVNVVDNDYINGDIMAPFEALLSKLQK